MNISTVIQRTKEQDKRKAVAAGNLPLLQGIYSKSEKEKLERQQKTAGEIDLLEKKKENLKGMECGTIEEIGHKLETLQAYADGIYAAKASYNREQMKHMLDEAKEFGERIAEGLKERKPEEAKTEAMKPEEAKTEAMKPEEAKTEAMKPEEAKTEAMKSEEAKPEKMIRKETGEEKPKNARESIFNETTVEQKKATTVERKDEDKNDKQKDEIKEKKNEKSDEKTPKEKISEAKEAASDKKAFYKALKEELEEKRKRTYHPMNIRI